MDGCEVLFGNLFKKAKC